jgi:copper resistance protein C
MMNSARVFALLFAALLSAQAYAHAFLDRAEPRVGSSVRAAPTEIKLWFTQELEPAFSTVQVMNAKGQRVDKGDARVDRSAGALLRVSLPALAPGDYMVMWRVVSVDTHVTQGDYVFHVGP